MKLVSVFFVFILFTSCKSTSNKYMLEKAPILSFESAYFQDWSSGIKGGGAGVSIYLFANKVENVKVEGIFFKEKYAKLKYHGSNKYQSFIKNNQNLESDLIDDAPEIKKNESNTENKIPFILNKNEAVVCYLEKGIKKYMKITLLKKESTDLPK